jgi:hypothetical protein
VLTSMLEDCGVVVVPSSAGEDANVDFRNFATLISMTLRGRRETRMSVTLMQGSSLGARRHCQPPVVLTCSHLIVQQL